MAGHEKVYGVCENKCLVETMSKKQIEALVKRGLVYNTTGDDNTCIIKIGELNNEPIMRFIRIDDIENITSSTWGFGQIPTKVKRLLSYDLCATVDGDVIKKRKLDCSIELWGSPTQETESVMIVGLPASQYGTYHNITLTIDYIPDDLDVDA